MKISKKNFNFETIVSLKSYLYYSLGSHLLNLRKKSTSTNFWIMVLCDALCVLCAYLLAYSLRFEAFLLYERKLYYAGSLILIFGIKLPVFYLMGLYNGMWRYTGLRDLQNIVNAVLLSSAIIVSIMLLINRFRGFSRAVFIMDAIICLLFLCASRISIRYLLRNRSRQKERPKRKKRLLLIGAGDAAEKVVREIADNPKLPYEIVGFVDDNPAKIGMRIHSIPVLGATQNLAELADQAQAEELLIAIVAMDAAQMKRIVGLCQQTGLSFKVLPGFGELIEGKLSVSAMRDISYSDLLGRDEIRLDQKEIGSYLSGQTILVTGAGGSIGSELCRQIIKFNPQKILLFDSGEENLYNIQMELFHYYRQVKDVVPILGKIQNEDLLNLVFAQHKPSVVFHAAAYKHVPLLEYNPWEGVTNNVIASKILMEAAIRYRVKRFVLVSTDKAVRPTNVMGATKRLTELIMLACWHRQRVKSVIINQKSKHFPEDNFTKTPSGKAESQKTRFMAVRFGNVLGSSGSVIPLFKRQIEKGGPVTVTDQEITRYFMSIEEAGQLILQAGAMGKGGEIFLLKMGTPIKIVNLAHDLIKLMGYEPETEIKINFVGLRPGEKLYEELITEGEGIAPTRHDKIMVLRGEGPSDEVLEENLAALKDKANYHDTQGIKEVLKNIIPEYTPDLEVRAIVRSPFIDVNNIRN